MYKELKSPVAVQLELTTRCNHKCIHCYNHWRKDSVQNITLSENDLRQIIDNLRENECPNLLITGGEPMLNKKVLFRVLERAKKGGITTSVNSTLVTLTENDANRFKELGVSTVLTSILGPQYATLCKYVSVYMIHTREEENVL